MSKRYALRVIIVSVTDQMLYHRRQTGVFHTYSVSTAAGGVGNNSGSLKTPLGSHRICARIGEGMPILTTFVGRIPVGIFDRSYDDSFPEQPSHDWILTRILWLEGMETGKNRRGRVDTKSRFIYIHGTHEEDMLGTPASHGCIRMCNTDILKLFEHTHTGEIVRIIP